MLISAEKFEQLKNILSELHPNCNDGCGLLNEIAEEIETFFTPPNGCRLILATDNLLDNWDMRTKDGRRITAEWGKPDQYGWYCPTFTVTGKVDGLASIER